MKMIPRTLQKKILQVAQQMPIITLIGPRQSGKTTLSKHLFASHTYVNLELPDNREFATIDPSGFFHHYSGSLILDEIQHVPTLLSYIQSIVDERQQPGQFVLTGSQNLLLTEQITQSLAGRTILFTLLPLSLEELSASAWIPDNYMPYLLRGGYPRIYAYDLLPVDWLNAYLQTYVERDVRKMINIRNLRQFQTFLKLCAGHIGQVINYTSFSNAVGVHNTTIKEWFSILEASYLLFLLKPYHNNLHKRLIKSPKLYFYDTGLACTLLGITSVSSLTVHPLRGALFENLMIGELLKYRLHSGLLPNVYFWRDNSGLEVDCIVEQEGTLSLIEFKSTQTLTTFSSGTLKKLQKIINNIHVVPYIVYGGDKSFVQNQIQVLKWQQVTSTAH